MTNGTNYRPSYDPDDEDNQPWNPPADAEDEDADEDEEEEDEEEEEEEEEETEAPPVIRCMPYFMGFRVRMIDTMVRVMHHPCRASGQTYHIIPSGLYLDVTVPGKGGAKIRRDLPLDLVACKACRSLLIVHCPGENIGEWELEAIVKLVRTHFKYGGPFVGTVIGVDPAKPPVGDANG